jgi:epoxide hydrolase-like predicted phosphatase
MGHYISIAHQKSAIGNLEVSMPIQAIIFDIGGVLVRTMDRAPRAALARRFGMTSEALEELVFGGESGRKAQRGEITYEQQWAYVCQQLDWPVKNWRVLEADFFAGDVLDGDLIEIIHGLHTRYKTGIISNAMSDLRTMIASKWHFEEAFDVIITSAEVGVMKPDVRIFQAALLALDVPPQATVFVDDFAHNVAGAQAVGMHAIHFRSREQVLAELETLLPKVNAIV